MYANISNRIYFKASITPFIDFIPVFRELSFDKFLQFVFLIEWSFLLVFRFQYIAPLEHFSLIWKQHYYIIIYMVIHTWCRTFGSKAVNIFIDLGLPRPCIKHQTFRMRTILPTDQINSISTGTGKVIVLSFKRLLILIKRNLLLNATQVQSIAFK